MKVDPGGLTAAAQRIAAALAELGPADAAHPPLGADPASIGGAARLSVAGATLAALVGGQAASLTATAELLGSIAAGFVGTEAANIANLTDVTGPAVTAPPVHGWAAPVPRAADIRPPLPPPAPTRGEALSRWVHAGDPRAGDGFAVHWTAVAAALDEAAAQVRAAALGLPDTWDSPVAAPVVGARLRSAHAALRDSAARAYTLAAQSGRHAGGAAQARLDVPAPQEWDDLNAQIRRAFTANRDSGGALAPALAGLYERKRQLDARAQSGYLRYHGATDTSTADDPEADRDPTAAGSGEVGSPADAAAPDATAAPPGAGPGDAGGLAAVLPALLPTVLGAAGGLIGGALSVVTKAPEVLAQTAGQAAGAATQTLAGALAPLARSEDPTNGDTPDLRLGPDGDGGAPGPLPTSPATASGTPLPAAVATAGAPKAPGLPTGGTVAPPGPPAGTGGMMMPMGMPMGAAAPGRTAGGTPGPRPRHVVVPRIAHTEPVTGKIREDRIARAASADVPAPPPDPSPPGGPPPLVRRITTPPRNDPS